MSALASLLNQFSVRTLILGNSLLLLMLLALSSGYAVFSMGQIGRELESIAEHDIPLTESITRVTEHQLEQSIHLERALRLGLQAEAGSGSAANALKDEIARFNSLGQTVNREISESGQLAENAIARAHSEEETAEFRRILEKLRSVETLHQKFENHSRSTFELVRQHRASEAEKMSKTVAHEADQLTEELEGMLHEIGKFTEQAARQAQVHEQDSLKLLTTLLIVSIIVGLLVTYIINRSIWVQIGLEPHAMNSLSARIADGDLSMQLPTTGKELGIYASMITMIGNLKRLIEDIQRGAENVTESSRSLAVVTEQTNHNLECQHQNTEQVATAITEMTAAVEEVARNTTSAADAGLSAKNQLDEGGTLVQETVQGIQTLSRQLDETMTVIGQLEQEAVDISGILDVIKRIADQTNLLALNAAIEAARAGEQGRGFAVVADEVRSLAKSTQESASEIEDMIERLQSSANSSITAMRAGSDKASQLLTQSDQVTRALQQAQQTVSDISDMNLQIASAAEEQKAVSADISQNVLEISSMSKESGEGSQQLAMTSEELAQLASTLQGSAARFKLVT